MALEGWQVEQVTGALISGFNKAELARLVHAALDTRIEEIVAPNSALSDMAYEVVTRCDRDGTVATLIDAACKAKPNNPDLRLLAEDTRRWTLDAPRPAQRTVYPPAGNRAPAPPADFVARPEEYEALLAYLLAEDGPAGPIGITGLYGAGGYGKTTLAQALCRDPAVIARYPDGILWVELREEPGDLTARLLDQVVILTGRRPEFRTLDAAQSEFAAALGDRRLLLVVDDVWESEHLEPFLQGGTHCTRLVTTRFPTVLSGASATVRVDAMKQTEAVILLGAGLPVGEDAALQALAARLGEWPFLLRPVNGALRAYVKDGLALPDALKRVNAELTDFGLDAFTGPQDAANRKKAVTACIGVSLRLLPEADQARFADLAVFPEDADVPLAALEKLWRLPAPAVQCLCRTLGSLSLLQRLDLAGCTLRMHDVMRTFLCERQPDLPALHARFLDSYELKDWTQLPVDEPYMWDHLAYHLDAAHNHADLRTLFIDDLWLLARVTHDGYIHDGYISDLNFAWAHANGRAERQIKAGGPALGLAESIHYALIRTSINSLSSNYVPELVARAVEIGVWSPARGLSVSLKIPDVKQRSRSLVLLSSMGFLDKTQYQQATGTIITTVEANKDEQSRVYSLLDMSRQLGGEAREQVLERALLVADLIGNAALRATALAALSRHLSGDARGRALEKALAAIATITDEEDRTNAQVELICEFDSESQARIIAHWLLMVSTIKDKQRQVRELGRVAAQLVGSLRECVLEHGLKLALKTRSARRRAEYLAALIPQLSGTQREQALERGLTAVESIRTEWARVWVLEKLAPQLADAWLMRALQVAHKIQDKLQRTYALSALLPYLSGQLLMRMQEHTLTLAESIEDEWNRAHVLATLAPHLTDAQRERALAFGLATVETLGDASSRVSLWAMFATHLRGVQQQQVLEYALITLGRLKGDWKRESALAALAPQLSSTLLERALSIVETIENQQTRAHVLARMAPQLSGDLLMRALAVGAIKDEQSQASALATFAQQMSGMRKNQVLERGLAAVEAIQSEWQRQDALVMLAPQLSDTLLEHALRIGELIKNKQSRARALAILAPRLDNALLSRALMAAEKSNSKEWRALALAIVAPLLNTEQREHALECGLAAAEAIRNERMRAGALVSLAPNLNGTMLERALAAAAMIQDEWTRTRTLAAFLPNLSGMLRERVLQHVLTNAHVIEDERQRAEVLAVLVPQLEGAIREEALRLGLAAFGAIKNEWGSEDALALLAPQLSGTLVEHALRLAETIDEDLKRAKAIITLTPHMGDAEIQRSLAAAEAIGDERLRADILVAMAPQLRDARCKHILEQALTVAQAMKDDCSRARALGALSVIAPQVGLIVQQVKFALNEWAFIEAPGLSRARILTQLTTTDLFVPPIFNQASLDAIAQSIMDVCWEWRWL